MAPSTAWTPERLSPALDFGVVDQAPVRKGGSAREALREAVELATATEALGYRRFWVAEHHNLPSLASTSPEILIGQIAAHTQRIRVGSGGVMLMHYSALKVAENFRMLESLYPGRIDLGLGRAPGGDPRSARALAHPAPMRDVSLYPQLIDDLVGYLQDDLPPDHPFAAVRAGPSGEGSPEVWLLGSGIDSALLAAERGLPFSFAHFFGTATEHAPAICEAYRRRFRATSHAGEARLHLALQVTCAETEAEAERLASSLDVGRIQMARQQGAGILPPEEALAYHFTPEERAFVKASRRSMIVGDPGQVRDRIEAVATSCGARELGIVTICYDFQARKRSYELVAEAFGIRAAG